MGMKRKGNERFIQGVDSAGRRAWLVNPTRSSDGNVDISDIGVTSEVDDGLDDWEREIDEVERVVSSEFEAMNTADFIKSLEGGEYTENSDQQYIFRIMRDHPKDDAMEVAKEFAGDYLTDSTDWETFDINDGRLDNYINTKTEEFMSANDADALTYLSESDDPFWELDQKDPAGYSGFYGSSRNYAMEEYVKKGIEDAMYFGELDNSNAELTPEIAEKISKNPSDYIRSGYNDEEMDKFLSYHLETAAMDIKDEIQSGETRTVSDLKEKLDEIAHDEEPMIDNKQLFKHLLNEDKGISIESVSQKIADDGDESAEEIESSMFRVPAYDVMRIDYDQTVRSNIETIMNRVKEKVSDLEF